jgi:hypothetical protein
VSELRRYVIAPKGLEIADGSVGQLGLLNVYLAADVDAELAFAAAWNQAFADNQPLPSGEYPHLLFCNASRQKPLGCEACICNRPLKQALAKLAAVTAERDAAKADLKALQDSAAHLVGNEYRDALAEVARLKAEVAAATNVADAIEAGYYQQSALLQRAAEALLLTSQHGAHVGDCAMENSPLGQHVACTCYLVSVRAVLAEIRGAAATLEPTNFPP